MKHMKKLLALGLSLIIAFSAAGCIVRVNEEKNRNIVVAVVDGEHEILKGEFLDLFNTYLTYYYAIYGDSILSDSSMIKSLKETVITTLAKNKAYELEMEKSNFLINDEDRQKAKDDFEEDVKTLAEQYEEEAKEAAKEETDDAEDAETPEERDFEQEARDYYLGVMEDRGMTYDEYIEEAAYDYAFERYKEYMTKSGIEIKPEDVYGRYTELRDSQIVTPDLDAEILIYEPAGIEYKVIEVRLTKEEQAEYDKLFAEDKTAAAEYIEGTSKKRAEEYYNKLKKGTSFETIMKQANEFLVDKCDVDEDDIKSHEEVQKLYKSSGSTGYAGDLDTKLFALPKDAYTAVLDAENGVYVIGKCYKRFESSTKAYEEGGELYQQIYDLIFDEKVEEKWTDVSEDILEKHTIKIYYSRINKNY